MTRFTFAAAAAVAAALPALAADRPLVMTRYTVKDVEANRRQPLMTVLVPKGWKAESSVQWTLASVMAPHSFWARFTAPDDSAAVELLPVMMGQYTTGPYAPPQGDPGPKDVAEGLLRVAKAARPKAKLKVTASESTKAKTTASKPAPDAETTVTEQTGTVTVTYAVGDREVEEEFAGSVYVMETSLGGMVTRNWFVHELRAVRADRGKLAGVRPVGVAVVRSAKPTAEFLLAIEFAKECVVEVWRRGVDLDRMDSELWRRTNREISDTWRKTTEERWASQDKRFETMQDLLGGVQRFRSEKGYEVLLPQSHTHAWEGPDDTYLLTNDPSYRPDADFQGTWVKLKAKRQVVVETPEGSEARRPAT
jgi:hypothetical protein